MVLCFKKNEPKASTIQLNYRNLFNMLRTILLILTLSQSAFVFSQFDFTPEEKAEIRARFQAYRTNLNLTEEQQPIVDSIVRAYFAGLVEIRGSSDPNFVKLDNFKKLSDQRDQDMKEVLRPDQYAVFEEFKKEVRDEIREKRSRTMD